MPGRWARAHNCRGCPAGQTARRRSIL